METSEMAGVQVREAGHLSEAVEQLGSRVVLGNPVAGSVEGNEEIPALLLGGDRLAAPAEIDFLGGAKPQRVDINVRVRVEARLRLNLHFDLPGLGGDRFLIENRQESTDYQIVPGVGAGSLHALGNELLVQPTAREQGEECHRDSHSWLSLAGTSHQGKPPCASLSPSGMVAACCSTVGVGGLRNPSS